MFKEAARYAQSFAESNMIYHIKITRMGDPKFDSATGSVEASEIFVLYEGKARVYTISGPVQMGVGEEPTFYSSTYVSIPVQSPLPMVNDMIEIIYAPDSAVVGRQFRVMDVESGGQFPATRRVQVTGIQPSKQWVGTNSRWPY